MLLRTELDTRTIRFDGVSIVKPDDVPALLACGIPISKIRVTHEDENVSLHNDRVEASEQLRTDSEEPITIPYDWRLPLEYLNLDLAQRIFDDFSIKSAALSYNEEQKEAAFQRIQDELSEIEKRGMVEFTRTIIYVLDTFRSNGIVWGVGRGSSCACYILFVLGLHTVDCVRYDIPLIEFFHD